MVPWRNGSQFMSAREREKMNFDYHIVMVLKPPSPIFYRPREFPTCIIISFGTATIRSYRVE